MGEGRGLRRSARRDVSDPPTCDGSVVAPTVRRRVRAPSRGGVVPRIPGGGGPVARHAFVGLLEVEQAMIVLVVRRLRVVDMPDQQAGPQEGGVESDRLSILDKEIFRSRAGQAQAKYLPGCLDRIDRGADLRRRHAGPRYPSEPAGGPGATVGGPGT